MSESDMKQVEEFILQEIREANGRPIPPEVLIAEAARSAAVRGFAPGIVTAVIWNLVGRGKIAWTQNHELSAA